MSFPSFQRDIVLQPSLFKPGTELRLRHDTRQENPGARVADHPLGVCYYHRGNLPVTALPIPRGKKELQLGNIKSHWLRASMGLNKHPTNREAPLASTCWLLT